MGAPCRITGTGENATVTFCDIGRSDYYYNLPVMEGISSLVLDNAFLEGTAGEIAGVNSIAMEKGGLTLQEGTAEIGTLSGSGELRLENQASLAVTDQASGSFTLYGNADSSISVPAVSYTHLALQKIFVIEEMEAWNPNLRSKTAIRTSNTRYFVDPSIAVAALGLGPQDLIGDLNTFGLFFETMCIRDLRVFADALNGNCLLYTSMPMWCGRYIQI